MYDNDGKHVQQLKNNNSIKCVKALFFRAKGNVAVAAVWKDGSLAGWSWNHGSGSNILFNVQAHETTILDMDISPDHSLLVTGAAESSARVNNLLVVIYFVY